jgi:UDP-N-acetylmuramate: L-alanyl-gamma-D-glutamyl-meso-diaminopimelate ligase
MNAMHIHILGVCGTFMGGLAALAREAGHRVTGCDSGVYPPMSDQLRALGIELIEGYAPTNWPEAGYVCGGQCGFPRPLARWHAKYPLMEAIMEAGLPYTSGPAVAERPCAACTWQSRHVLAIAGTHGKTTTTAMLAGCSTKRAERRVFGSAACHLNFGVSARLGSLPGPKPALFVIEADEYDTAFFDKRSKFVHYRPRTAVLNNLEFDHADIFPDLAAIERQFHHLVRTVPASGRVVVNAEQDSLQRVLSMGCWSEVAGFGFAHATWQLRGEPGRLRGLAPRHGERWPRCTGLGRGAQPNERLGRGHRRGRACGRGPQVACLPSPVSF